MLNAVLNQVFYRSLVIRSFTVPVGLDLLGGIAGLAALAKGYGI
jgi:hypothetical protein